MARLPAGDPAPDDGALPREALAGAGARPFGFYVHVPFCASRCGYCDFNTYVPEHRAQQAGFVAAALIELRHARSDPGARPASPGFFGGGPPPLLGPANLARLLHEVAVTFGLAP